MFVQYYISLFDLFKVRGNDFDLFFYLQGVVGFVEELQDVLCSGMLFECWKVKQFDLDVVELQWGVIDLEVIVIGEQKDLCINLVVIICIDSDVFKQCLCLLVGSYWELCDVC